jgi:hypothetical protein
VISSATAVKKSFPLNSKHNDFMARGDLEMTYTFNDPKREEILQKAKKLPTYE